MDGSATPHDGRRLFIVERFWPGVTLDAVRMRALPGSSAGVRPIGWMLIPDDETVLTIVESPTAEAVVAAELRRSVPLPYSRVLVAHLGGPAGSGAMPLSHMGSGGHGS